MSTHHRASGRFRNPWPMRGAPEPGGLEVLKWMWDRWRSELPPDPSPERVPRAEPDVARPRLPAGAGDPELRLTFLGHAAFLVQLPGLNLLTDPVLGPRASPVPWAGPKRFTPPGLAVDELPPIDAILLSHDHYDHLDSWTVKRLRERSPGAVWFTPLGYARWFERRGIDAVVELDWWQEASHATPAGDTIQLRALPVRHWSRRTPWDARRRLWCSWAVRAPSHAVYFGGDSGYCPVFWEIGARCGPFDVALLPVGAYEPRWFMKSSHMNPEEAAQVAREIGARAMVGMHWGAFRLTDEDPLEPPLRTRRAWDALGLPRSDLYLPGVGETLRF